jgi:hypothetical protein
MLRLCKLRSALADAGRALGFTLGLAFCLIANLAVLVPAPAGAAYEGPGVDTNNLGNGGAPVTGPYTIQTADCGKTIQAGTGSTGQLTLTLPVVTGFAGTCSVLIKNGDTTNGKILSGFPSDLNSILWPQQSVGVKIVNGGWLTFYNPGRWSPSSQPTIYVNGTGGSATCGYTGGSTCATGNDTNDGLTPATPLASMTQGINNLFGFINAGTNLVLFNLAHGSSANYAFQCARGPQLGQITFAVTGDNNAPTAVKIAGQVSVKDQCFPTLRSLEVDGGSSTALVCDFFGGIDLRSVTIGPTTAAGASANHGCPIDFLGQDGSAPTNSINIGTGAVRALQAFNGGSINLNAPVNIPSNITVSDAFYFSQGGYITGLTGGVFTGAGTVTGPKCNIADTSSSFDGNPNTYLPGTSNCPYPFLPTPTASTLGGIESYASVAHQWINGISTSGVPSSTQPATSDLSDVTAPTSWTATDGSGANLTASMTISDTRYTKTGKSCTVSFYIGWPATSDTHTAQINGIPSGCTAFSGTLNWVAGGAILVSSTAVSSSISWVTLQAGGQSLFVFGNGSQLTNANMSGGSIRGTITYITN